MQLSPMTVEVLKNFSTINTGIFISQGQTISTIANSRQIVGLATLPDSFPQDFAIYDLPEFLNVLSLFDNPELEFDSSFMRIRGDGNTVTYHYSNPEFVAKTKSNTIPPYTAVHAKLTIPRSMFDRIRKSASILGLEQLVISADGVSAVIPNQPGSNEVKYALDVEGNPTKEYRIRIDLLKMIPDTYVVEVVDNMVIFTREMDGSAESLQYVVALEND